MQGEGGKGIVQQKRGLQIDKKVAKRSRTDKTISTKSSIPAAAGKRSSIYRGVTRHRWTGRYEAHLWDKNTWNANQNKKGKQVYLGAYDEEVAAARAYDLAALKYWGEGAITNFPVTDYAGDVEAMEHVSREEYLASLRRKSSGFSRGVSKYRGVARHHHNGRWEARIGRVFGNKYLYLGTYSTQEEAAAAYDMAAIEYRGLNAVTNFDLSRYIRWLKPGGDHRPKLTCNQIGGEECNRLPVFSTKMTEEAPRADQLFTEATSEAIQSIYEDNIQQSLSSPTALSLVLQSSVFRQMLQSNDTNANFTSEHLPTPPYPDITSFLNNSDVFAYDGEFFAAQQDGDASFWNIFDTAVNH